MMPERPVHIPSEQLHAFTRSALHCAGVEESIAEMTADALWLTSLRGVDSHGVRLLPHYVAAVEGGRINPKPKLQFERTSPSTGVLDADHAFGHAAGTVAMQRAIELANEAGTGHVVIRNSSHCGSLASFTLPAAERDMLGMSMTHATSRVRSPGGARPFFGNNPMCWVAPMLREPPFCFDAAMTALTFNKVKQHRESGTPLPPVTAADADGFETTDPNAAEQLIPIGDYKGFGLAMVVDLFCGVFSGMPVGREVSSMYGDPLSKPRLLGQFVAAYRIDTFETPDRFKQRLQDMADALRREPATDPATPVRVPGDPEKAYEAERRERGIPLSPAEVESLRTLAERLHLSLLEPV